MIAKFKGEYGSGVEPLTYLGQNYMVVDRSLIPEILQLLRNEEQFDYCVDITAVHYPKRDKQFDVVWILYSFSRNERVRVKTQIADGASIPSSVSIWQTANWLEREVFDMSGVKFRGHPDLRRILMYPEFEGHPLQKTYPADLTQPLVAYRTEEEAGVPLHKQEPFGPDEGMPFGRRGLPRVEDN